MEDDETCSIELSSIDGNSITIQIPSSPKVGDIWLDTNSMDIKAYSDDQWVSMLGDAAIDLTSLNIERVMFEDDMPDPQELKEMCAEYPGLEKAYENFKAVYKMVEQDWRGKQSEQGQFPF